jgi:hypothetical protein
MLVLSLIVLLLLIALVLLLRKMPGRPAGRVWPVYAKQPLTHVEQALYFRLVNALPDCVILAQVQYSRFLGVKRGAHNPLSVLNSIQQKSADFLVCDKSLTVLAVIELDDASHARRSRRLSDTKKEAVLKVAGIRLVRWQVNQMPDTGTIQQAFTPGRPIGKLQVSDQQV